MTAHWSGRVMQKISTVKPAGKITSLATKKCGLSRQVVSGDRLVILKYRSFCRKCVVCQDRWSLMAVVFKTGFTVSQLCGKRQRETSVEESSITWWELCFVQSITHWYDNQYREYIQNRWSYSETWLEWKLSWEATCLEGPYINSRKTKPAIQMDQSLKTT